MCKPLNKAEYCKWKKAFVAHAHIIVQYTYWLHVKTWSHELKTWLIVNSFCQKIQGNCANHTLHCAHTKTYMKLWCIVNTVSIHCLILSNGLEPKDSLQKLLRVICRFFRCYVMLSCYQRHGYWRHIETTFNGNPISVSWWGRWWKAGNEVGRSLLAEISVKELGIKIYRTNLTTSCTMKWKVSFIT